KRAAPLEQRAVVDDRDAGGRNALADPAAERARFLAVEVSFEPVTDRLVQQDPRPARTEHDGHRSGRGRTRIEVEERLVDRFGNQAREQRVVEARVVEAPSPARRALFAAAVVIDDHGERRAYERSDVGDDDAVAA